MRQITGILSSSEWATYETLSNHLITYACLLTQILMDSLLGYG